VEALDRLSIRPASADDTDVLHSILVDCGTEMRDRLGLTHWVPAFPRPLFEEQVAKGNVFAVGDRKSGELVATFTLSRDVPPFCDSSLWSKAGEPALYMTHLAVRPGDQRRGIGRRCVAHAEHICSVEGLRSLRFDALAEHEALLRFYARLGFLEVGRYEVFAREMVAFEKRISSRASRR